MEIEFNEKVGPAEMANLRILLFKDGPGGNSVEITILELTLDATEKQISVKIDLETQSVDDGTIHVEQIPPSLNTLHRKNKDREYFDQYPIVVEEVSYFSDGNGENISKAASIGSAVIQTVTVVVMVTSFPLALMIIKLFQAIDFLVFININQPKNSQ